MNITKKTHFNPCLWTALWNDNYYNSFLKNETKLECRKQELFSLKVKSNKIIKTTTENVFYEKNTGIAELTKEIAIDYCKRNFPNDISLLKKIENDDNFDLTIDFENHFSMFEYSFEHIFNLIKKKQINNITEKGELSYFVFSHLYRSPLHLNNLINIYKKTGRSKIELFLHIKHNVFGNKENLMKHILPIVSKEWTIAVSKRYIPISDNPIMHHKDKLYVTISPYLLIIINKNSVLPDSPCKYSTLTYFQYKSFLKLMTRNTYNEIVAHDERTLEKIKRTRLFKKQINKIESKEHLYYKFAGETLPDVDTLAAEMNINIEEEYANYVKEWHERNESTNA